MKYKIVLNRAKGNPDEASYEDIIFSDDFESAPRNVVINAAIVQDELKYEDVEFIEKVQWWSDLFKAWSSIPEMPVTKYGVHATHCCVIHGCKYADYECPVSSGKIKQEYPCESCDAGDKHSLFGKGDGVDRESLFYD